MAELKEIMQAKTVFDNLCGMLNKIGWNYERDDDKFIVKTGAQGDDLPIELAIEVDPEHSLIVMESQMPFTVPEDKRQEIALAVSVVNFSTVDGSFDYDFISGKIKFRITSSFRDSLIGEKLFHYMLVVACQTIDNYNDKFLMIIKDKMTLEELIKFVEED